MLDKKRQEPISDDVQLAQSLNPIRGTQNVASVDYNPDFEDLLDIIDKLEVLEIQGKMDPNLIRCLSGKMKIEYQGLIYNI